jgi:hypothetical protein
MTAAQPTPIAPSQLDNALRALRLGFKVFPCRMDGKEPNGQLVPNGVKESTTSEEQVRRWWKQCPNGNPGIHGGTIVDCDKGISSGQRCFNVGFSF